MEEVISPTIKSFMHKELAPIKLDVEDLKAGQLKLANNFMEFKDEINTRLYRSR